MKFYKRILLLMVLFLCYTSICAFSYATVVFDDISDSVFRLHIIANSDSKEDQDLKLLVRDNVLKYMKEISTDVSSKEEVISLMKDHLDDFKSIAISTIRENGFDYDLIGYVDELGILKAAALILIKKISLTLKYGYSPKGFLIDYFDTDLLASFTKDLKEYYSKKLVFIKINPELAIGKIDPKTLKVDYNQNLAIRNFLKELGYKKLKDNIYFESLFPRYNGIINTLEYNFDNLSKNTKNKIRKALKKGLVVERADFKGLDIFYNFIKRKKNISAFYYKNYYNIFAKNNNCELFLVKIDFERYLLNSKKLYEDELAINNRINSELIESQDESLIKRKMESDKKLVNYKNDIAYASANLNNLHCYIGGALVVKYKNRANIVISGIDKNYRNFNANYLLHYNIIEYYKNICKYIDINGMTGDFSKNNSYARLNDFKMGFKPNIYEFIGEFDLIIKEKQYNSLLKKGILANEYKKIKF